MILNFAFLGISTVLILSAKISVRNRMERAEEYIELYEIQNISIIKDRVLNSEKYTLANFLEDVFMAPKSIQKRILFREQKNNVRILNLIMNGTITFFMLLYLLYTANKINYHL